MNLITTLLLALLSWGYKNATESPKPIALTKQQKIRDIATIGATNLYIYYKHIYPHINNQIAQELANEMNNLDILEDLGNLINNQ